VECFQKNVARLHGELRHERFGLPGLASVLSRSFLTYSLAECGAFAKGSAPTEEGVWIAEAADHPYSRILAYSAVGFRSLRQGDLRQAIPVLERGLELCRDYNIDNWFPLLASALGAAYALSGRSVEAREQARAELSTAIDLYRAMDMTFWLPQTEAALAEVDGR
jgi:hypothetical protein